jgi:cell division protein FtsB
MAEDIKHTKASDAKDDKSKRRKKHKVHNRKRILGTTTVVVACLVFATFMLYPVGKDYYTSMRSNQQLSAELDALNGRNNQIQDQINDLQTPEGIEDRAREEFGWVPQGEQAVNITGLSVTDSSTKLPAAIEPGSVSAPSSWITNMLDFIFGVQQTDNSQTVEPSNDIWGDS